MQNVNPRGEKEVCEVVVLFLYTPPLKAKLPLLFSLINSIFRSFLSSFNQPSVDKAATTAVKNYTTYKLKNQTAHLSQNRRKWGCGCVCVRGDKSGKSAFA